MYSLKLEMWKNSGRATKAGVGNADCSLTMAILLITVLLISRRQVGADHHRRVIDQLKVYPNDLIASRAASLQFAPRISHFC